MLANAGCAGSISATTDMRPWRPITYSCKDTPKTRDQVLKHNSTYDSLANGSEIIIRDRCPQPKPTQPGAPTS